jgi:hypothetical protein
MAAFQGLAAFALFVAVTDVFGAAPSVQYVTTSNGVSGAVVTYSNGSIDFWPGERQVRNSSSGGVTVADRVPVNTSRGAITTTARSAVSGRAIARGAAVAARAFPAVSIAVGVGSVIWDLLDDQGIRPDGQGGLNQDPGVPPTPTSGPCWRAGTQTGCYSSMSSSASAYAAALSVNGRVVSIAGFDELTPTVFQARTTSTINGQPADPGGFVVTNSPNTSLRCGPVGDFTPSPRADGRCPTGQYTSPLTDDQVIDIIAKDVTDSEDRLPLVQDILGTGGRLDITPGSIVTSGPSSITGTPPAPVVTNTPAGPVTVTESPRAAIRYRGSEVEWEPEQVTTRRPNPLGGPEEVTVEDAPDLPSADPNSTTGAVTPDYCLQHPNRAGCSELGDVEGPDWLPTEKQIELVAESPWGSDNAACPAPRTIVLGGRQYQWEWTLVCQFFSGIRFAVIAAAWVSAVMIFIGSRSDT